MRVFIDLRIQGFIVINSGLSAPVQTLIRQQLHESLEQRGEEHRVEHVPPPPLAIESIEPTFIAACHKTLMSANPLRF